MRALDQDYKLHYHSYYTISGSPLRILPFGRLDDYYKEIRHMIDTYSRDGVLVLRVSSINGFDVSVKKIASWYKTARDYTLRNWGN